MSVAFEQTRRVFRAPSANYSGWRFFVEDAWKGGLLRLRYERGAVVECAYMGAGSFWVGRSAQATHRDSLEFDGVQPLSEQQAQEALEGKHPHIIAMEPELAVSGLYDEIKGHW